MRIFNNLFLFANIIVLFFFTAPSVAAEDLKALNQRIDRLEEKITGANEWKSPYTLVHLAGYADAGFVQSENQNDSFNVGTFSPIFHFQFRDLVVLESELEFEQEPDGSVKANLDYLTIDYFLNDYVAIIVGKFLSPIGMFRQNLHPSWINKMASAPPGFGHDGAAPISDLGLQIRGGFNVRDFKFNYSVYTSNGPELHAITEDSGATHEIEGIVAEGFGADRDGKKTYGSRLGFLPIPSLEIGVSYASGKASVSQVEDEIAAKTTSISGEAYRNYRVVGSDFSWAYKNLKLRGEYVKTDIGEATEGTTTSEESFWEAWYAQFSYRFNPSKWESVLRYTKFDSPHPSEDQKQWALGLNYLFSNNFVGKFTYELNEEAKDESLENDRTIIQLAYGF